MRARKRFGQHFLEAVWAERLVAAVRANADETFVEIGPGRGALTLPLARRAGRLVAVEIDRDLVAELAPQLPSNASIVEGDVLSPAFGALIADLGAETPVRVVGNLPYNISSPILFRLIDIHRTTGRLRDATLMLQREVADRVVAAPGSKAYGVLSIAVQMDARASRLLALPPGAFRPAPAVSSAVVRLEFQAPAAPVADRALFDAMVMGIFAHRRKTMGNALKTLAAARGADAADLLRAALIDPVRRPETLSLLELASLANLLASAGRSGVV